MKLEDVTHYLRQELEGASMKTPSDQSYRYTPVDTTPNVAITSAIPVSSVVQRASRNGSYRSKRTRKNRAEESSRSPRQPTGMYEALIRPYKCDTCGRRYAQRQGLMRHYRAKHNPNSCMYCDAKWSRPYQYLYHLEEHHRDVDPDQVLGKRPVSRRKVTVIRRGQPHAVSPPVIKRDRRSQATTPLSPLMPPLPAVVKDTQVPPTFSSTEAMAQPVDDVVDRASRFPKALPGRFTVANCSSRPVMAYRRSLLPVGGPYGSPVSAGPMFEPPGFIHPYP